MKITISSEDGTVIDVSEQYTVTVQLPNSKKHHDIDDVDIEKAYCKFVGQGNKTLRDAFFAGAKFIINGSNKHGQ